MVSPSKITLPQGSITAIIAYLSKNGLDINQLDKYILRALGKPQSGEIDISYLMKKPQNLAPESSAVDGFGGLSVSGSLGIITKGDFLYALTSAKAAQESITLIPGETMYYFIKDIAAQLRLNEQKLWEAYKDLAPYEEGVILPDTYKIHANPTEQTLMTLLVRSSLEKHQNLARQYLGSYDEKQWFKHIAMASIIQKEAANTQEMPIIAAVIYNRIKINMPLQMDGSLNYGQYSHAKVTPDRIRNDKSPYNTYLYKGIPPLPVGSVSIEAIRAVFEPADVEYLFFVRNKNGTHSFSKTFKEHRENFDK